MSTELLPVTFQGDALYLVEHNGQPFTPAKPIADALRLAWQVQARKLKDNKERWGITLMMIPSLGGSQEMICLPLRKLPAWLLSIDPRKVKSEARAKIELYQSECDNVLWAYWFKQHPSNPRQAELPLPVAPLVPAPETVTLTKDDFIEFLKIKIDYLELKATTRPRRRKFTADEQQEVQRLAAAGLNYTEIGRRVGRAGATIRTFLRRRAKS
jgi:hypothetical protein